MRVEATGFNVEDEKIVISVALDRRDGAFPDALGITVTEAGVIVPPDLGLSETEVNAVRDEAAAYRESEKDRIEPILAALEAERVLATDIYHAAKLVRSVVVRADFGHVNPPEIVQSLQGARGSLITAVTNAKRRLDRHPVRGEALKEIHRLGDTALGGLLDFVHYAEKGSQEAWALFETAQLLPNQIDQLTLSYEVTFAAK